MMRKDKEFPMSSRSQVRTGSRRDAAKIAAKREANANHFQSTVLAGVYPQVPQRVIEQPAASVDADLLAHLDSGSSSSSKWVERVKDYGQREQQGWDPTVVQMVRFETKVKNPKTGEIETHQTVRYLAPEDSADSGNIFKAATNDKGRTLYKDGQIVLADEPIGRWTLDRAEREQVTVERPRSYAEVDGELKPISVSKVYKENGERYCFRTDIDDLEMDPSVRCRVVIQGEPEQAQVMHLGDRYFAHRNFLGTLSFESNEGGSSPSWPIMEVDPNTIERNRAKFNAQVARWEELTPNERREARKSNRSLIPMGAGFECFLVKKDGVTSRKDNMFVEMVERNGELVQLHPVTDDQE